MPEPKNGSSSEGVVAVLHPRSDFPQNGWISYAERSLVPLRTPVRLEQIQSFRSEDRLVKQRKQLFYRDFTQSSWVTYQSAAVPIIIRFPLDTVEEQYTTQTKKRKSPLWYISYDPMGWIAAVQPAVNPAIRSWQEESSRLSPKHLFPQGATQDLGWISPLLQSYDPSIQSWTIDSTFNSKHKPFPLDNIDVDWISATFSQQAFDPATLSWTIPSTDRTVINQSLFHDSEKRPVQGGISEEVAATPFDPSTMEWGIDTLLPASKKDPQVWFGSIKPNENFGLTDARPIIPAIQQLIDSVQRPWDRRKKKSATDEPLDGWLTTSLPAVWDPQFTPYSTDLRLAERYKRVPHVDTLFEGWLSPVLPYDARFFPRSLDARPYARYRRQPQLDQAQPAWQYTTTAAIVSGTGALHMGDSTMTGAGTAAGSPVVSTRLNTIDLDYNIMLIKGNT